MSNFSLFQVECDEFNLDLNISRGACQKSDRQTRQTDSDVCVTPLPPNTRTTYNANATFCSQNLLIGSDRLANSFTQVDAVEPKSDFITPGHSFNTECNFIKSLQSTPNGQGDGLVNNHTTKSRRKIPGPAGTLPKLREGQVISESLVYQTPRTQRNHKDGIDLGLSQSSQSVSRDCSTHSSTWSSAIADLDSSCPALFGVLERFSLSVVPKRVKMKTLPSCKVPVICALIESISLHNIDASVVLKDPSGSMPGALHREIVKEYGDKIYVGSVLVLKQVGVFSPAFGRNCYLNITPNNVIRIYTKSNSSGLQSPPSITKVQDPHFLGLSAFSESIMKLSDSSNPESSNPSKNKLFPGQGVSIASKAPNKNVSLDNNTTPIRNVQLQAEALVGLEDISPELLDDWIDDEEIEAAILSQDTSQSGSNVSLKSSEPPINDSLKTKSSIFSIGSSEDFMLLPGTSSDFNSTGKSPSFAGMTNSSLLNVKRNQLQNNPPESIKRARASFKGTPTCSKDASDHGIRKPSDVCNSNQPSQNVNPGQPSRNSFKFKSVSHPASSNLSSQKIPHKLEIKSTIGNSLACKGSNSEQANAICEKGSVAAERDSFDKLMEGLDDEMFCDF